MSSPLSPVYVPMHRRSPSASSAASSTHTLTYTRDELLSMAPSTSTTSVRSSPSSSPSHSPSSSPSSSSGAHFPASFLDHDSSHTHLEHTYAHPLGPHPHNPASSQGWHALNTAMRSYLRLACPEIVMNRKMRKSVEFAQFQHRLASSVKSPTRREHQRGTSREMTKGSAESNTGPKRERAPSPSAEEVKVEAETAVSSSPAPTGNTPSGLSSTRPQSKRPAPARRTPASRAPRTPRTSTTRSRYNSFALFHKQLSGHGAGAEDSWRKPVGVELTTC